MKTLRILAILLGMLLLQQIAGAQTSGSDQYGDSISGNGDPTYTPDPTPSSSARNAAPVAPTTYTGTYDGIYVVGAGQGERVTISS